MKVTYDKSADAMYIYLKTGKVAKTHEVNERVLVDLDRTGKVIGIEILGVSEQIPKKEIGKIYSEMPVYA
jgi:uncharacterized protein YuzE